MNDGFNLNELNELRGDFLNQARENQKKIKKFIRKEGTKLKNLTKKQAKRFVKKKTGNYFKSIKRGKYYSKNDRNNHLIKVYSSARHAHFIENGHVLISHGQEVGCVPGKNIFKKSRNEFETTFNSDIEDFLTNLVSEIES